jgi:hypothetical protein
VSFFNFNGESATALLQQQLFVEYSTIFFLCFSFVSYDFWSRVWALNRGRKSFYLQFNLNDDNAGNCWWWETIDWVCLLALVSNESMTYSTIWTENLYYCWPVDRIFEISDGKIAEKMKKTEPWVRILQNQYFFVILDAISRKKSYWANP